MRLLLVIPLFLAAPLSAAQKEQMTWAELPTLINRDIRLALPNGAVIRGPLTAVQPDGLVIQVKSTTDKKLVPTGRFVAPRADVKTLDRLTRGKKYRVIGTICGVWGGLALGAWAGMHTNSAGPALATFAGVGGGLTTLGYFAGSAADTHTVTIVIIP